VSTLLRCLLRTLLRLSRTLLLVEKVLEVGNTEQVVSKNSKENVEADEGEDDAEVPPSLAVVDGRTRQELVRVAQRAVVAASGRLRVLDGTARGSSVIG